MQFHRQHIGPHPEQSERHRGRVKGAFVGGVHRRQRQGLIADRGVGQVAAEDFHPVQIDHRAVVAQHPHDQVGERGQVGDGEAPPEVGGDVFAGRTGAVADHGGFVAVAVTQLGGAGRPGRVVEVRSPPGRALIGAVVEILPAAAGGHQTHPGERIEFRHAIEWSAHRVAGGVAVVVPLVGRVVQGAIDGRVILAAARLAGDPGGISDRLAAGPSVSAPREQIVQPDPELAPLAAILAELPIDPVLLRLVPHGRQMPAQRCGLRLGR